MVKQHWPWTCFLYLLLESTAVFAETSQCAKNSSNSCGSNSACTSALTCQCLDGYGSPTGRDCELLDTKCHSTEKDCVKCDGTVCLRCLSSLYVTKPNGQCVATCAADSVQFVLTGDSFQGQICEESGSGGGLSTTYIIVICVIAVIAIALIVTTVIIVRMRNRARGFWAVNDPAPPDSAANLRAKSPKRLENKEAKRESKRISREIEVEVNKGYEGEDPDEEQQKEFMSLLAKLRDKAPTFLVILNDMRKKLKTLDSESEGVKQCKKVIKDLTRLLFLLNKKPKSVRMPSDGLQLLTWSEHVLTRFRKNHPERAEQIQKETEGENARKEMSEEEFQKKIEQDETHF